MPDDICPYFGPDLDTVDGRYISSLERLYLYCREWAQGGSTDRPKILELVKDIESHGRVKPYAGEL